MPFSEILGQEPAVASLIAALRAGRVPHAYRFEGPEGVGKELAARALAQSLLCEKPSEGLACRGCSACRRVLECTTESPIVPLHPDLVLVARGLYPASLLGSSSSETAGIGIDQVRRIILVRAGFPPHEGRALVFLVRAADELTVAAANALLKTLEEPQNNVYFILLTSRPRRLLDTIRSRTLAVRFAPLSDAVLGQILDKKGASREVIPMAAGSASAALELADPEVLTIRRGFAESIERALAAPDLARALGEVDSKHLDRDSLRAQLGWLAARHAQKATQTVTTDPYRAERLAHQHAMILGALRDLERNAQPQLTLESLLSRLRQG